MGGGVDYPRTENKVGSCRKDDKHLRGIVDMGSNGIRFSVTNLAPPASRILPTLISYRLDIGLYDAQYDPVTGEQIPIPDEITDAIVAALLRFRVICKDLKVAEENIRVIATEATRTAINSAQYRKDIKKATDFDVEMLGKEEEGYVGALGVASGFSEVSGLVMDLGGGSMQITWLKLHKGHLSISPKGSVSFPYGAAALTRKLASLRKGKSEEEGDVEVAKFRAEMKFNFIKAYQDLEIPTDMVEKAKAEGGFPLYLSGGGFRGWGYLLLYLSQIHGRHYPISLINGFSADQSSFEDVEKLKKVARQAEKIFRVSDRRRQQVPAVAFLVNVVAEALPHGIKVAHFAQGGVREGALFRELDPKVRNHDPLEVATKGFATESADEISDLIQAAIPKPSEAGGRAAPKSVDKHMIHAFANILYVHSPMSKETASTAALYTTSTGLMATTHGVSHSDRALLALMLEERYEGELPPRDAEFKLSLQDLLTSEEVWWTMYLGAVGRVVTKVYPAAVIQKKEPRVKIHAEWASGLGKHKQKEGIRLIFRIKKVHNDPMMIKESLEDHIKDIRRVGKKKNWVGGKKGWGIYIDIKIQEVKHLE
ncbi:putative transcription regulator RTG2 [Coleophoma cylindrospora]|uniref:Putative transcription regulator RTG2 n=1 Tax=Coleophoma cylindrospora TaxID=1849047 RepID=A0A3D8SNZ1_9HELO|nr:putative transcription regulator RTG2 [Coleophoma cylindrospora]